MAKIKAMTVEKPRAPQKFLCPYCGEKKSTTDFYTSSDPMIKTGLTVMCRECAQKIARNYDENSDTYGDCTRASIQEALERLDKPFIESVWESSITQLNGSSSQKGPKDLWSVYITNLSRNNKYKMLRWRDGDVFSTFRNNEAMTNEEIVESEIARSQQIKEEYHKNRDDVIRLIGYDPFLNEMEKDKPLLYSQLIGFLDTGGDSNDDMMRVSSAISIVRGFLQIEKIDDMIAGFMKDPIKAANNVGTIKSLQDTKQKVNSTVTNLAAESCLSLKNNKNASKGEDSFTGRTKRLKDMNLREMENNAFDIGTADGMRQVADISNASILKQIHLDENDYTEMLGQQRELIVSLQRLADENAEKARILLRENVDLKRYIEDKGIDIESMSTKDTILYRSDIEENDENEK